ncbi:MAG: hypothetical protein J6U00_14995 [Ruminococcus sp.]|uniref:hypothetical protein n=1 Tax=Ruminococcus sp. TaxID=41978 RepID=UPI001B19587F|nr:hypothetical protein [Ruminococcus sp.]MBO7475282.1 hypothetical protein [Ruminococcus sp.]
MKKIILLTITAAVALTAAGCGQDPHDGTDYSDTSASAQYTEITATETITTKSSVTEASADDYYLEATWQVASVIRIEASSYFTEDISHPQILHDIVCEDGGFGSHLIETHPALKGMEYIVEFDDGDAPYNSFCIQTHTEPVTIGCSGTYKKLSDWGFETWDDVLKYFNLSTL